MRIVQHPKFPQDIKRFEAPYREISDRLALRFRAEVEDAIERIKNPPTSAGHFLNTGSKIVREVRRRNQSGFPVPFCMVCMMICSCFVLSSRALRVR